MKKSIFGALCAALICCGTTFAQHRPSGDRPAPTVEQRAQMRTDRMTQELSLSEQQAQQVYEMNLAAARDAEAQMAQMQKAREARAAKLKTILTPEQYEKWVSSARERRPGKAHYGRGHKQGDADCGGCQKQCDQKKCCKSKKNRAK